MPPKVTPEAILKELGELWVGLGAGDEAGVLRACAMTLIIAADEEEEAGVLGEMIAEIMHDHPSRAIVLRVRDGADPDIESRVLAQCWMPFGRRQQICCEQIEIMASETGLQDVPRIVLGVMAPDLPVVLVCRSPNLFSLPAFQPLLSVAGKVIVDSRCASEPQKMLGRIASLRQLGHAIHDLAWTALTPWREVIACAFDDRATLSRLHEIHQVSITTGKRGPGPEAWYLGAWLLRGLGLQTGIEFAVAEEARTGPAGPPVGEETSESTGWRGSAIRAVDLRGAGLNLSFSRDSRTVIRFARSGVANNLPFTVSSDWELMREELALLGKDHIFEEVLPRAIALAGG
ncbi:MAG: glucose-6-phosphate dehydrogenase assembly protein OpcA [Bryobacterales bacterium]|nr:glucose-6-phosphate dehydrogenase assembly protein OpcA [Bryobacterales bacterium]